MGTASQGKTIEDAIDNLQEATGLYFEEFPQESAQHPFLTTFEVPVHAQSLFPYYLYNVTVRAQSVFPYYLYNVTVQAQSVFPYYLYNVSVRAQSVFP